MKNVKVLWVMAVVLLALGFPLVQASDFVVSPDSGLPTTTVIPVDVSPFERAEFALPHPGTHGAQQQRVKPGFKLKVSSTDATSVRLQWQPQNGASEYEVSRDGNTVGNTVAMVGYFTDFGLDPGEWHQYSVAALDASGVVIAQSKPASAKTRSRTTISTDYNVLAIAFNPEHESLATEEIYLKHRIQFLKLASLGSAVIHLYKGGIVSSAYTPAVEPGTNYVDYLRLVTQRDLPGLNGYSIVDLIEKGSIDHGPHMVHVAIKERQCQKADGRLKDAQVAR